MPPAVCSRQYSRDSAWVGVFVRNPKSSALSVSVIISARYLFLAFLMQSHFLLLDLLTFKVHSLGRLWTGMGLMYPLAEHQQQYQRSLCLHPVSEPWLSCYYSASSWLWQFLWGDHRREVFAPSTLSVWNQMPWRNLQTKVLPPGFLLELLLWFDGLSESVMLWIAFSENHSDSS